MTGGRGAIDSLEAEAERRSSVLIVFGPMMPIDQLEPGYKQVSTATLTRSYSIEQMRLTLGLGSKQTSGQETLDSMEEHNSGAHDRMDTGTEDWSSTETGDGTDTGK
ncbi:hypothetical protein SRHO_G00338280 [Serrasalmus rhombeus]